MNGKIRPGFQGFFKEYKKNAFHFYHYYDITYSSSIGYQKKMNSGFVLFNEIRI